MGFRIEEAKEKWRGMRASTGFHNFVLFLAFVAVATLFWLVMSLNDSVTKTFEVALKIENVPDTVTFINEPPEMFHVTLRDKGTNILRSGVLGKPHVGFNFRDFSENGIVHVTKTDINSAVKGAVIPRRLRQCRLIPFICIIPQTKGVGFLL